LQLLHLYLTLYDTLRVKRAMQAERLRSAVQVETLDLEDAFRATPDLDRCGVLPHQVLMLQAQRLQGQPLPCNQAHSARQPAALVGALRHGHGEGTLLSGIRPFHADGTRRERWSLDLDYLCP